MPLATTGDGRGWRKQDIAIRILRDARKEERHSTNINIGKGFSLWESVCTYNIIGGPNVSGWFSIVL